MSLTWLVYNAASTATTPAPSTPAAPSESLLAALMEAMAGALASGVFSPGAGLDVIGAKVVGIGLTETADEMVGLTLAQEMLAVELGAVVDEEVEDEDAAAAPQSDGSMPSGQQTPFDKQKEPLGQDQVAEQHFWPAPGL